jgi:hypothetical protein
VNISVWFIFIYSTWESFLGLKRPERDFTSRPPSITEVKERVELHLYCLTGSSWPASRVNLDFYLRVEWGLLQIGFSAFLEKITLHKSYSIIKNTCLFLCTHTHIYFCVCFVYRPWIFFIIILEIRSIGDSNYHNWGHSALKTKSQLNIFCTFLLHSL